MNDFGNDRVKANNTDDLGFWFEKQSCDIYIEVVKTEGKILY